MTYDDVLKSGKKELAILDTILRKKDFDAAYNFLWNTPQPDLWIKSEKSNLVVDGGGFFYNEIGLIENLGKKIFQVFEFEIQNFNRVQDRSKFSSTVVCVLSHAFPGETTIHKKFGIASVASASHSHLTLSDPMAYSNAKKSAARELGAFFGKNLNRILEDLNQLPTKQLDFGGTSTGEEYEKIVTAIKSATFREDAHAQLENAGTYKMGLKYNSDIVNIINAKPFKNSHQ